MRSKLDLKPPPKYHPNDKQNIRKRKKMENRLRNRKNPNDPWLVRQAHMLKDYYCPPIGSNCYNRWAWLFRP